MSFFNMFGPESPTEEHTSTRSVQEITSMLSNEADEAAGERQMTQDEVNRLVHDALRRARKATSPRKRSSQAAQASSSPRSLDSNRSSRTSPPTPDVILSSSPTRGSSSKNRNNNNNNNNNNASFASDPSQSHMDELLSTTIDSQTSTNSKHSSASRTRGGITKHLHNIVGTVSSDPSQTEMDTLLSPTMDSIETGSYVSSIVNTDSIRSVNSSDSVLRKVEEEIQNARRAAQEHRKTHKEEAPEILLSPTQELSGILDDHLADDADLHDILDTSDDFMGEYFERAKSGDNWDGAEQLHLNFRREPEGENDEAGGVFDDDSEFDDGEVVVDDSQFIAEEDAEVAIITSRSSQGISPNKKPSVTPQTSDESPSDRLRPEEETPGSENAVFMGASPDPAIDSPLFDEPMEKGIAYSAVGGMEAVEVGVEVDYMAPSSGAADGSRAIDDTAEEKKFDNPAAEKVNGKLKKRDDFIGVVDEPDLIEKLSKSMSVGTPRAAPSKNPSQKTAKAPTDEKEVRKNGQRSLGAESPDFQDHIERYASATQDSDDKAETKVAANSSEYSEKTISDADVARIGSEVILSGSDCTEEEISEVDSEYTEETVEDDEMERTDSFSTANETAPSPPKSDKKSSKPQPLPTVISGEAPPMDMRASTPIAEVQASRATDVVDISTLDTPVARTNAKERKVDIPNSSSKSKVLQQPNTTPRSKPNQKAKSPSNKPERGSPWSSTRKGNAENVPPKSPARVQKPNSPRVAPPPPPPPKQDVPVTPTGSRKIHFRNPYPYPPPLAQPRSTTDIVNQNKLGVPDQFTKWFKAKPDLQQLLMAARGDSLHRRSNACGALKVLSQQKKNQLALVRTKGFLDALVFAISAPIPENHDTDIALDSRGRAVTTLHSVADPKDNRQLVMVHPGIADCLLKVIEDDEGEARVQACATLAILAKTAANREYMANVHGLLDILGQVLLGSIDDDDDEGEPGILSMEDDEKNSDSEDSDGESEDGEASSVGGGSKSFSSVEDGHTTFDDETMSIGVSSSMSSIQPPTKKRTKQKSIRMHKDDMHEQFLRQARVNACAALIHLSKHCAVSTILASNASVIGSLVEVSREFDNPIHTKCVEMICNLTRFPSNPARLARNDALVETLIKCGKSKILADRIWSMRSFQNITSDSSSKVILANARILTLLSICSMRKDYEEQLGAVAALYNLSTEPGAVVPLTNTRNVVATLVHLAHNAVSTPELRNMACDALATIGLWLQTLAGSGVVPPSIETELLPSHQTTGWQRWD